MYIYNTNIYIYICYIYIYKQTLYKISFHGRKCKFCYKLLFSKFLKNSEVLVQDGNLTLYRLFKTMESL